VAVMIGPVSTAIAAPAPLVYQMLSAIGQGGGHDGERAEVLERDGDELVADFWTQVKLPGGFGRLVRTRERVTLQPPERIDYEHLDGPVRGLRESITVRANAGGGTQMTYFGSYEPGGVFDNLRARLLAGPAIRRVMEQHFDDVRALAEARAARSRVFREDASVSPTR